MAMPAAAHAHGMLRATCQHFAGATAADTQTSTTPRAQQQASQYAPTAALAPVARLPGSGPALQFGCQVASADLSCGLTAAAAGQVRALLDEYGAVLFTGQALGPGDFAAVMRQLQPPGSSEPSADGPGGTLARMISYETTPCSPADDSADPGAAGPAKAHLDGFPHVRHLGNATGEDGGQRALLCETGYEWHPDSIGSWQTALYCPHTSNALAAGGETLLCSAAAAYTALGPAQRAEADGLTAVYSNRFTAGGPSAYDCHHGLRMDPTGTAVLRDAGTRRPAWALGQQTSPLVMAHSRTGRKYICAVCKNLEHFGGMDPAASRAKLTELLLPGLNPTTLGTIDPQSMLTVTQTVFDPSCVYAHRWRPGDLLLWDNEQILHSTTPVALYGAEGEREIWQIVQDCSVADPSADQMTAPMVAAVHFSGATAHDGHTFPGLHWAKDATVAVDSNGQALTPNVVKLLARGDLRGAMAGPAAAPDGAGAGFRMYYHELVGGAHSIVSAWSPDGDVWEAEPGVRMAHPGASAKAGATAKPDLLVWSPDVVPLAGAGGGYRMYFEARRGEEPAAVLSAVSSDGLAFTLEPGVRLGGGGGGGGGGNYGSPRCLHLEPADKTARRPGFAASTPRFRLYVADFDSNTIVSAVGEDGLYFEIEPGTRVGRETEQQAFRVYAPEVVRLGRASGWRMFFAGWCETDQAQAGSKYHGRIFSAFSNDGVDWVADHGACVDNGGEFDTAKASEPCVIELPDGRWRMFYEACDLSGQWRIASATSVRR